MSGRLRGPVAGVVLALSLGAGLVAGLAPGRDVGPERQTFDGTNLAAAAEADPGDRMQEAVDGVRETGFYVAPELRGRLTDDEVDSIERIIAGARTPLYVVWMQDTADAGYNTPYAALDLLRAGVGEDGYYAVIAEGYLPLVESVGYSSPYVEADAKGRPAAALTRYVTELAAIPPTRDPAPGAASDYWGGAGGGLAAGLLFAFLGYVGLVIVVGLVGLAVTSARKDSA